jgi:hypothetical protein
MSKGYKVVLEEFDYPPDVSIDIYYFTETFFMLDIPANKKDFVDAIKKFCAAVGYVGDLKDRYIKAAQLTDVSSIKSSKATEWVVAEKHVGTRVKVRFRFTPIDWADQ